MTSNLSPQIRSLPLYSAGVDAGRDIGLVIALNAIVVAGVAQELRANRTDHRPPPAPTARVCCGGWPTSWLGVSGSDPD